MHNLKGIDVDIPHHALTVVTGLSGSGKSSLAFDTLYAEGQRRYVETFSPYTRQFLERMDKPAVDRIDGLPPAIAIEQANSVKSSRSTVGSMTEINDYLRLLFPRLATLICPGCQKVIKPYSAGEIASRMLEGAPGAETLVTFVVPFPPATLLSDAFAFVQAQGFLRVWMQGQVRRLDEAEPGAPAPSELHVIQDRLVLQESQRTRLVEAIESALRFGQGVVQFMAPDGDDSTVSRFANKWYCPDDQLTFAEPTPSLFSFNNPLGACPTCRGFGRTIEIDYARALPDRALSIEQGVVKAFQGEASQECQRDLIKACRARKIPLNRPFYQLTPQQQAFVLEGEVTPSQNLDEIWQAGGWYGVKGYFRWLETKTYKMHVRVLLSRYRDYQTCPTCLGQRFQPETLNFKLFGPKQEGGGRKAYSLADTNALPLTQCLDFYERLEISASDEAAGRLRTEVATRLRYLVEVGLGYLTVDRSTRTLSGGEIERVNLTSCLGNSLVNTLFVLDEPTIGLHPRDTAQLLSVIHRLRDRGNTVVVVEHEEEVMRHADFIIDLGPGRGEQGGQLTYAGDLSGMLKDEKSLTGQYLSGRKWIPLPDRRRPTTGARNLKIVGANLHNLRDLTLQIPLQRFVAVSGVSGSGKSTLVHEIIHDQVRRALRDPGYQGGPAREWDRTVLRGLQGCELLSEVIHVDQSPLTRTPRSNAALYLGVYDSIRELFAQTDTAQAQGFTASTFSFNGGLGRCPRCRGLGLEKISMQFLADVYLTCPICDGKRFQPATLAVKYRGRSIDEVLGMTVEESLRFFDPAQVDLTSFERSRGEKISRGLSLLHQVGLSYLRLGQPLNQLSGGEAQRVKLISYLSGSAPILDDEESEPAPKEDSPSPALRSPHSSRLFILDEPTTGLHYEDIRVLLELFQRMVEQGDSLLVIEHNLDVIKCADWVIELGPEAGSGGGQLVVEGTPETLAAAPHSPTGRFLPAKLRQPGSVLRESNPALSPMRALASPVWPTAIEIRHARHHNLKDLSVDIGLGQITVITGLSGSGKSTLAFDLLFAEGQRRYLESLNSYARQFVEQLEKPAVESITGLPPSVAIEQRLTRGGRKSTVATVTEIQQFIRLLYAKLGVLYDPETGEQAVHETVPQILRRIDRQLIKSRELTLLAPLIKARKGLHTEIARWAQKKNYPALRVDGKWIEPAKFKPLSRFQEHTIDLVLGNISRESSASERKELLHRALQLGRDTVYTVDNRSQETIYSTALTCPESGRSFDELDPRLFSFNSPHGWCPACQGYGTQLEVRTSADSEIEQEMEIDSAREGEDLESSQPCAVCQGTRLNAVARSVRLPLGKWAQAGGGPTLPELDQLTVAEAAKYFASVKLAGRAAEIARDILPEIRQRLAFLQKVGLDYLSLDRSAFTLSGGESQRIRLAAQLGSNLQGVLYVLDEPTIGLHPRDNDRLLDSLEDLRSRGNTLVIVEHDLETMQRADRIIDLGPGAGRLGGEIVADGHWKDLAADQSSITGKLLGEPLVHPLRGTRRPCGPRNEWVSIEGARVNNLRDLDVRLPLARLIVLCGVSGAGKSTLVHDVLKPAAQAAVTRSKSRPVAYRRAEGLSQFASVCEIDQSPIGKTSRSTPATYLGLLDNLRALFAQLPTARQRGYTASRFSYNAGSGRCEACQGQGVIKVEMQFLPTAVVPCETCQGKRYNRETLEVTYQGRNIAEVLALSVDEAVVFFAGLPKIQRVLQLLAKTGLGYLTLGQASPTLSGGESQRLKLVAELSRSLETTMQKRFQSRDFLTPKNLYLLEEPTIGLHLADVKKLLELLQELVDTGHTVVVIEHHLNVIAEADHLIELGPEAGLAGGQIIAQGSPEKVARSRRSRTAPYLRAVLAGP